MTYPPADRVTPIDGDNHRHPPRWNEEPRPDLPGSPEAKIESYNQAHEVAVEMGYPSLTEALEHLDELRSAPHDSRLADRAPNLCAAFRTTVSEGGKFTMVFRFPSMEAMHKADDEWRALRSTPAPDALRDVWQQARENHEEYSATGDTEQDIRFFALGLAGEAGEVANFVKKRWRDGDGHDDDLRKECADVFAYNIMLADALGMSPDDLIAMVAHKQQVFIDKMKARALRTEGKPS